MDFSERMIKYREMKLGLARIKTILVLLENPQDRLGVIHIAGTNGKGSTAHFINSIYNEAGYSVGRFTSPSLEGYEGYISINGINITSKKLNSYLDKIESVYVEYGISEENKLTEFESMTVISLLYFADEKVDLCIYEVGLGGLEDATNIFEKKLMNVITSISLDHTQILGNTIEDITHHKLGIVENGGEVIVLDYKDNLPLIKKALETRKVELNIVNLDYTLVKTTKLFTKFCYKDRVFELNQPGRYQIENAILAIETVKRLGYCYPLGDEAILDGIKKMRIKARLEWLTHNILIDGSHNIRGIEEFVAYIQGLGAKKVHLVFGILKDKDLDRILDKLGELGAYIYVVEVPFEARKLGVLEMMTACEVRGIKASYLGTRDETIERLMKSIKEDEIIAITGSLYTAAKLRVKVVQSLKDSEMEEVK